MSKYYNKINNRSLLIISLLLMVLIYFDSISDVHSLRSLFNSAAYIMPEDTANVKYSVQICASFGTKINADSLKNRYNIKTEIKEIKHRGWYKYSVGEFSGIREARALKLELRKQSGLGGAFIVCFKNNVRQESIVIKETKALLSEKNVEYRIQVKASYNIRIPIDSVAKEFSLIDLIKVDIEDGWYKYTVGSFESFKAAKEYRNKLRQKKGLEACFVVAYENDKRLSALPVSKITNFQIFKFADSQITKSSIHKLQQTDSVINDSLSRQAFLTKTKDSLNKDSVSKDAIIKVKAESENLALLKKKIISERN